MPHFDRCVICRESRACHVAEALHVQALLRPYPGAEVELPGMTTHGATRFSTAPFQGRRQGYNNCEGAPEAAMLEEAKRSRRAFPQDVPMELPRRG